MENISNERIENVARKWRISKNDAYKLIVTVESQQTEKINTIVINPFFNNSIEEFKRQTKKPIINKKKFRCFFCCL